MEIVSLTTIAFGIGMPELVIIFFVLLLLFGAKRLPELARGMGKAMNEFKRASSEVEKEFKNTLEEDTSNKEVAPKPEKTSGHQ